ncbi:hypothetical protein T484DRAFT_1859924, partial [Baffinella frigidus]
DLEVIHWLEDTERMTDPDEGFKQLRYALPRTQEIYCESHATSYVLMCIEEMFNYKAASKAELKIMAHHVYTLFTAHGKRQWGDRFVENSIGAGRSVFSNTSREDKATKRKVTRVLLNLRDLSGYMGDAHHADFRKALLGEQLQEEGEAQNRGVLMGKTFKKLLAAWTHTRAFAGGDGDVRTLPWDKDDLENRSALHSSRLPRGAVVGIGGHPLEEDALRGAPALATARAREHEVKLMAVDPDIEGDRVGIISASGAPDVTAIKLLSAGKHAAAIKT